MFSRIALRLAAVEALAPHASRQNDGPWPTIAGRNVYDSRLDPIALAETPEAFEQAMADLEGEPVIVVYTEDGHTRPFDQARWPLRDTVQTLVLEIFVATRGVVDIPAPDGQSTIPVGDVAAPITDAAREMILDVLEGQARRILEPRAAMPTASIYRRVARETREVTSDPQRAAERTVKLAMRTVKFHVQIASDDYNTDPAATGLAALPAPLRDVAMALPQDSAAVTNLTALAVAILPPPPLPALNGVDLIAGVDRDADPLNPDVKASFNL